MFGSTWSDFDRTFAALDELRRRLETPLFRPFGYVEDGWPRVSLDDTGAALVVTAEVPGLTDKDLDIQLDKGTLTLRGERKLTAPEGYAVHRRERSSVSFARSLALPARVDAEKTTASVKDGVLTITLAKAAEDQPRQIAVKTA